MRRVVVTGMGIVSPIGDNIEQVLQSLREGKSGIVHAPDYEDLGFRCQVHGAPKVDPFAVLDRRTTRFMGKGAAWNYIAMLEAIAMSGLEASDIKNERTGIIMGSGGPSTRTIFEAALLTSQKRGTKRIGPLAVPKAMSSTASATLATPFGIRGINYSISSACATSAHCIGSGAEQIQFGKQDIVFVGGHEDLDWTMSNLFDALGAMTSDFNDTPQKASRPYDRDRSGFVIAGGAGVLVLEELEHAKARGAPIYGEVVGYAATSDGFDMVAPSGEGAERCMKLALENAGIYVDVNEGHRYGPDKIRRAISYINTHGTSTPIGDAKEIEAIKNVFGSVPWISSTKSLTGHSLGATSVHEAIYSLLMLNHHFIVQSANIENLDPAFEGVPIVRERLDNQELDLVMSNSFGFGGTNATLIFGLYRMSLEELADAEERRLI